MYVNQDVNFKKNRNFDLEQDRFIIDKEQIGDNIQVDYDQRAYFRRKLVYNYRYHGKTWSSYKQFLEQQQIDRDEKHEEKIRFLGEKRWRLCSLLVKETGNNMFLTVCSAKTGKMLFFTTLGKNLKGSRKMTPYGAEMAGQRIGSFIYRRRLTSVLTVLKSYPSNLVQAAFKGIGKYHPKVRIVATVTSIPKSHNGLRKRKLRRERKKKNLKAYYQFRVASAQKFQLDSVSQVQRYEIQKRLKNQKS